MKYLLFFFCFFLAATKQCQVRVLLEERDHYNGMLWVIESPQGFLLTDPADAERTTTITDSCLTIAFLDGLLWLNGKKLLDDRVKIDAIDHHLTVNGLSYQGSLIIVADSAEKKLFLINKVHLEDYVFSVVRWESWPGWPLEFNKAFAITCRTYVLQKIMAARSAKKKKNAPILYDIKATNIHQTYKGIDACEHIRQAVQETAGLIMTHKKKPIIAMYDACCGGIIPAHSKSMDFRDAPYLARKHACTHCKDFKIFNWTRSYDIDQFSQMVQKDNKRIRKLTDIKVSKKDTAGLVQEVRVKLGNSWTTLTGKKVYSLCKHIKSFCFSITKKDNKIIFDGKGFGHHIGLCQWGASRMIKDGADHRQVLDFYYPGVTVMKVETI